MAAINLDFHNTKLHMTVAATSASEMNHMIHLSWVFGEYLVAPTSRSLSLSDNLGNLYSGSIFSAIQNFRSDNNYELYYILNTDRQSFIDIDSQELMQSYNNRIGIIGSTSSSDCNNQLGWVDYSDDLVIMYES